MDLKALMQKLETINTTQPVMESVETKQVITESVKAPVVIRETTFKSSIARSLAEEFGYDLEEAGPNDPNNTAQVTANDKATQAGRAAKDAASVQVVGSGTTPAAGAATKPAAAPGSAPAAAGGVPNPYQGADAAKFASMSPADQEWLTRGGGKPDINDEFILRRAPNGGKAVAAPAPAPNRTLAPAPAGGPSVAPGGVQAMGDDDGNTMITKPDGTVQVVGPDGKPLPNGGKVDPAAPADKPKPAADPAVAATREKFKALLDKLEKTGGVTGAAAAPAAAPAKPVGGAATKPTAKPAATMPAVNAMGDATGVQETVLQDDQTLLAIKNIRY
jgi:hypothetical protein